jgi:hypothetical protein
MKLLIAILLLSIGAFAQNTNKTITRTFTWESGNTCQVSVDTTKVHRYTAKTRNGSTYYQYPIKIHCTGFTTYRRFIIDLLDSSGFEIGGTIYLSTKDTVGVIEVFCDNPLRIYDATTMQLSSKGY